MNTLFASTLDRMHHEKALLVAQDDELAGKINEYQQQRAVIAGEIAGIQCSIKIAEEEAEKAQQPARKPRLNIIEAVADYLARQDGPRSVAGIARAVGRKPSQVKAALSRLMLTGRAVMLATDEGEKWRAPTTLAVAAE